MRAETFVAALPMWQKNELPPWGGGVQVPVAVSKTCWKKCAPPPYNVLDRESGEVNMLDWALWTLKHAGKRILGLKTCWENKINHK